MKPSQDINRMCDVIDDAKWAFWAIITKAYPEAKKGDFSPLATIEFNEAVVTAVTHWLEMNADQSKNKDKERVIEILLHRIVYAYQNGMEIIDSEQERIAYNISKGNSEGELSVILDGIWVSGYWKIHNSTA